jgi:hypothetical protein
MPVLEDVTFVVAVNNREVFENNFLASRCFQAPREHQILVQEGFASAATAYNDAIDNACNDLIVFCHQDIFLPQNWLSELMRALECLEVTDPNWGVLGCYGETLNDNGRGYVYSSGRGIMGRPFSDPTPVQTLDEIVLVLRKSSSLRFDDTLPHFHLYGTDICMRAAGRKMKSYAISAFCVHNTNQTLVLPREFYECHQHIKRVWKDFLPIQTTCIRITRVSFSMYRRRLSELYLRRIRRKELGGTRVKDVQGILKKYPASLSSDFASF